MLSEEKFWFIKLHRFKRSQIVIKPVLIFEDSFFSHNWKPPSQPSPKGGGELKPFPLGGK
jgi:hypothetical protein